MLATTTQNPSDGTETQCTYCSLPSMFATDPGERVWMKIPGPPLSDGTQQSPIPKPTPVSGGEHIQMYCWYCASVVTTVDTTQTADTTPNTSMVPTNRHQSLILHWPLVTHQLLILLSTHSFFMWNYNALMLWIYCIIPYMWLYVLKLKDCFTKANFMIAMFLL